MKNCISAIGFNTAALVDAMPCGVLVAVFNSDGLPGHTEQFVMYYGSGVMKLSSVQEMEIGLAPF
jgi:hypothetical protein